VIVRLTRLVGVFGGPHYVVKYRNGDRASYVSSTFEAVIDGGKMQPDAHPRISVRGSERGPSVVRRNSRRTLS
jgi:hypothetical protein